VGAVLIGGSAAATISTSAYADANCNESLRVVAAGGASGAAPELTGSAFSIAQVHPNIQMSVDVRVTRDNIPILMHDSSLRRTTNVEHVFPDRADDPVESFTYAELKRLDAGAWYGKKYKNQPILKLHDVLNYIGNSVGISITPQESLTDEGYPDTERMMQALNNEFASDKQWDQLLSSQLVEFSSGNAESLRLLARSQPDARIQWLTSSIPSDGLLSETHSWANSLGIGVDDLTESDAARVHDAGLSLALHNVNSTKDLIRALNLGASTIFTQTPALFDKICSDENPT
jgi:glycerophosphoryl diester phosphodiesterase